MPCKVHKPFLATRFYVGIRLYSLAVNECICNAFLSSAALTSPLICRVGIVRTASGLKRHAICLEKLIVKLPVVYDRLHLPKRNRSHPGPPAGLTAGEWRSTLSGYLIRSLSSPIILSAISRRSLPLGTEVDPLRDPPRK